MKSAWVILLLRLLAAAGLAIGGVDAAPIKVVGPLASWATGVAKVELADGAGILTPWIINEGIGVDGVDGRPSCSMSLKGGRGSINYRN